MKISGRLCAPFVLVLAGALMSLSGCVVHDRDTVHDGGYSQGYKEGYYDHEHNRYWHENAWHACGDHDDHCR
jgi:hypothetical protein